MIWGLLGVWSRGKGPKVSIGHQIRGPDTLIFSLMDWIRAGEGVLRCILVLINSLKDFSWLRILK